jgi:endonuclease-3
MRVSKKTTEIISYLSERYGTDLRCFLHFNKEKPYELLFATILSAQCTDERVNIVTEQLFKKYETLEAFANASLSEMENDIRSTGFYHNKAKNIIACARELIEKYDGEVPSDIDELTKLPGVGRKTANVIRGNIYEIPSIVVDTHVKRISNRLSYTDSDDPVKVEQDLEKSLPKDEWILWNLQIISFGREICTARSPKCELCGIKKYCRYSEKNH